MDFFDVIEKRRSIRKFSDRPVEKEKIEAMLDAALRAPSARNARSSEFVVVSDSQMLLRLSVAKPGGAAFIKEAALAIVVYANHQKSDLAVDNAAISAVYLQLAARALGLGCCWAHMRGNEHSEQQSSGDYLAGILEVPDHLEALCIIAIGYPEEEKEPYAKDELPADAVHWGTY